MLAVREDEIEPDVVGEGATDEDVVCKRVRVVDGVEVIVADDA